MSRHVGSAVALRTAVDAVVQQDLAALSLEQLQEQVAPVAAQVQRLSGFTGLPWLDCTRVRVVS